jgi:hypothetical protein
MPDWYRSSWFDWLLFMGILVLGWLLWNLMAQTAPAAEGSTMVQLAYAWLNNKGHYVPELGVNTFNLPPMYPLALAAFIKFMGNQHVTEILHTRLHPYLVFNLLLYMGSAFQVVSIGQTLLPRPWYLVVAGLYILSPSVLAYATMPGEALLFVVLSLAALQTMTLTYHSEGAPVTGWQRFWCCLFMALAILTRSLGCVLPLVYLVLMWRRRELQTGLVTVALLVGILMPWTLWEVYERNMATEPVSALAVTEAKDVAIPSSMGESKAVMSRVLQKAQFALGDTAEGVIGNFSLRRMEGGLFRRLSLHHIDIPTSKWAITLWAMAFLIGSGILLGWQTWPGLYSVYMLCYLVTTLAFPVTKDHLLIPVLPLVLIHLFLGVQQIGLWLAGVGFEVTKYLMPGLAAIILINDVNGHLDLLHNRRNKLTAPMAISLLSTNEENADPMANAATWLNNNAAPNSRVMTIPHPLLKTQQLVGYPRRQRTADGLMRKINRVDFVVDEPGGFRDTLSPVLQRYPERFKNEFEDTHSKVKVWRVLKPS